MEQGDIVKAHCNVCEGERNHLIVHCHDKKWEEQAVLFTKFILR